jgi:hypothetical protein
MVETPLGMANGLSSAEGEMANANGHAPLDAMGLVINLREVIQRGLEEIRNDVARAHSPWMCANQAARYADCSPSTIFKAANQGLITRYPGLGGPLFKREEIDRAITTGKRPPI